MSKNSTSVFFKLFLFTLYWLCWVFSVACRLSLVAASGGCSLVTVLGLRIVMASLVVEHGLQRAWASVVVVHGLSCPVICGIFLDQGLNPCPLPWQADSQHWTTRKSVFPFNVPPSTSFPGSQRSESLPAGGFYYPNACSGGAAGVRDSFMGWHDREHSPMAKIGRTQSISTQESTCNQKKKTFIYIYTAPAACTVHLCCQERGREADTLSLHELK